jgi:hypothetical protein
VSDHIVHRVVVLTCAEPPGAATQWTGCAPAETAGISLCSVQRIWQAHRLQPHRIRTFKRSNDPAFAAKLEDIVGLYVDPPQHAVVLSVDEKFQSKRSTATNRSCRSSRGKAGAMTHDYLGNGVTNLFAALNVLDGTVLGRCMQRHRQQKFLRSLNAIERTVPAGKVIHVILDNYAAHKHAKARRCPTSYFSWEIRCSWRILTRSPLRTITRFSSMFCSNQPFTICP